MGSGENRVEVELNTKRLSGVTVFGAVGKCLKQPVFMIAKATNSEEVQRFWVFLKRYLVNPYSNIKPHVILDNHAAHRSKKSMAVMEKYFKAMYQPA